MCLYAYVPEQPPLHSLEKLILRGGLCYFRNDEIDELEQNRKSIIDQLLTQKSKLDEVVVLHTQLINGFDEYATAVSSTHYLQ